MVMRVLKSFDGTAAAHAWVGRKATRILKKFLEGFGKEKLTKCIAENVWITDLFPPQYKAALKEKLLPHMDMLDAFSDDEVYDWIPEDWRFYIESLPNGRTYFTGLLNEIRHFLTQ